MSSYVNIFVVCKQIFPSTDSHCVIFVQHIVHKIIHYQLNCELTRSLTILFHVVYWQFLQLLIIDFTQNFILNWQN